MIYLNRLGLGMMMVAGSVAPALAGDGGSQDGIGALIVQAVGHLVGKLAGLF